MCGEREGGGGMRGVWRKGGGRRNEGCVGKGRGGGGVRGVCGEREGGRRSEGCVEKGRGEEE